MRDLKRTGSEDFPVVSQDQGDCEKLPRSAFAYWFAGLPGAFRNGCVWVTTANSSSTASYLQPPLSQCNQMGEFLRMHKEGMAAAAGRRKEAKCLWRVGAGKSKLGTL